MKTSMYFNSVSRSLFRGGQRTVLAFFCVAVGVMAIVALQLVGLMINNALTSNVRDANGGDIQVSARLSPFKLSDLSFFTRIKNNGTITNYTNLTSMSGSMSNIISSVDGFSVLLIDPHVYPLVTPPIFSRPADGSISPQVGGNGVVIDQTLAERYHEHLGQVFVLHVSTGEQNAQIMQVRITGIASDSGALTEYQNQGVMLVAQSYYQQVAPNSPVTYDTIDITTAGQAQTNTAVQQIRQQYPQATVQTVADALKSRQSLADGIKKFLEIAGLLALLIGGVGIAHTMQMMLSRRKTEIAMLKAVGYRRRDLYALFGLEGSILGLGGGILGSLIAIGVSYLVRNVIQQGAGLLIPFQLDWFAIAGGVLIGLYTALIFSLMPIVRAAHIRPLNVIRELPENDRGYTIGQTVVMLLILSLFFCVMSITILHDVILGILAVYGVLTFLLLVSSFFMLITQVISSLPVPGHLNGKSVWRIVGAAAGSALILLVLPALGFLLLALTVLISLTTLLPSGWRVKIWMALRNIGRPIVRTTTTLLVLFVNIFTIGLILVLGQNLRASIDAAIANDLTYNVIAVVSGPDANQLQAQITSIPGLDKYAHHYFVATVPIEINAQPLTNILQGVEQKPTLNNLGQTGIIEFLSNIEGYDPAQSKLPGAANGIIITAGRNLRVSDTGTNNVLLPAYVITEKPLKGKIWVGSTITVMSIDGQRKQTLTIAGFYRSNGLGLTQGTILSMQSTVHELSPHGITQSIFYMKVSASGMNLARAKINQIAPAADLFELANVGDTIDQYLHYIMLVLITVASLSLLAGTIIIANAAALGMLERRRELGILKAVGYSNRSVLVGVLIENIVIGGLGALLALLLITFFTSVLGRLVFKSNFSVNAFVIIGLILGSALLTAVTALLVSWKSLRVRPLVALRYE